MYTRNCSLNVHKCSLNYLVDSTRDVRFNLVHIIYDYIYNPLHICPFYHVPVLCFVSYRLRSTNFRSATMFPPPRLECSMATGSWQLLRTVCLGLMCSYAYTTSTTTIHSKRLFCVVVLMQCNIGIKKPKLLHK